ncbi:MAG: peptidoglycan editing factor PgeF, partial [Eubacterium sp.]|nr:peptidoglycan editing factor PgeF [Eubacterium sp.]
DYQDVDGMITDLPGLILVGSFADCVPLFFADPVHKAVGLSHAGWRGTVSKIGMVTVEMMRENYGSRPEDLICVIGPSICVDCYEVSQDVAEAFQQAFSKAQTADILTEKGNGKYQLNLWKANAHVLKDSGILPEHIAIAGLCTRCNSDLLWSHRATAGKRGGLCGFISVME